MLSCLNMRSASSLFAAMAASVALRRRSNSSAVKCRAKAVSLLPVRKKPAAAQGFATSEDRVDPDGLLDAQHFVPFGHAFGT